MLSCLLLIAIAVAVAAREQRTTDFMLPMRDGVKLHTRIVFPRNFDEGKKATTIVDRSPYGYTGLEWITDLFLPAGFITIGQDMRGTEKSEGNFTIWHSDANDSQDLGDWIVQQPWSNGKVFSFGASADGLASFTMPENKPEWLLSQYVIWSSSIGYEVIYPNGAYLFSLADEWMRSTVDEQADACLQTIKDNEMQTDWWDPMSLVGKYDRVHATSGFWAGWYDIFLIGTLAAYDGYNTQSDPSVRETSLILVDPLGHCQDAAGFFPQNLVAGRTLLGLAQAYQVYGAYTVQRPSIKNVTFYVMSSNDEAGLNAGQYWTSLEYFPEPKMTNFYLQGDGSVATTLPVDGGNEKSSFLYDPANPVPTQGGNNLSPLECGPLDQSEIDKRSDVLVFQTPVFEQELPLTGPITANLFVSSDAVDTDFMVRISDVYPTGEARLLQDSAIRMRWREGGLTPVYMEKDQVYDVTMTLWNTSYVVAPGHALRFAITSSNYPRFSVNNNNGILLGEETEDDPKIPATNTVFHSSKYPTSIALPVITKEQIPIVNDIEGEVKAMLPDVDVDYILKKYPDLGRYFSGKFHKKTA